MFIFGACNYVIPLANITRLYETYRILNYFLSWPMVQTVGCGPPVELWRSFSMAPSSERSRAASTKLIFRSEKYFCNYGVGDILHLLKNTFDW